MMTFRLMERRFGRKMRTKKPYYLRIAVPKAKMEWEKVVPLAKEWTKTEPNNTEAWYELGYAYLSMEKYIEAKEAFIKSNQCDKNNIDPLFELAKLFKEDDFTLAYAYYQKLNQINLDKALEIKDLFEK